VCKGEGREGRRKIRRKYGGPSTLLKDVAILYVLLPLAKPSTFEFYIFFLFPSTLATDGLDSGVGKIDAELISFVKEICRFVKISKKKPFKSR
jgi:hypothetical protein